MALDSSELFEFLGGTEVEPDQDIITRLRFDDALDIPVELTDLDLWTNYINEDLYYLDKKIREYFKTTRVKREAKGKKMFRTTSQAMFAWIYGRKATPSDSYVCRMIHMLLRYYCTEYTGKNSFQGVKVPHVYKFSKYATKNKRPYSLKLRLEEAKEGSAIWRANPTKDKRFKRRPADRDDGSQEDERCGDDQ